MSPSHAFSLTQLADIQLEDVEVRSAKKGFWKWNLSKFKSLWSLKPPSDRERPLPRNTTTVRATLPEQELSRQIRYRNFLVANQNRSYTTGNPYLGGLEYERMLEDERELFEQRFISSPRSESTMTDYEALEKLGDGSFGTVYLIQHQENNTLHALKRIRICDDNNNRGTSKEEAEYEMKLLRACNSPFIVGMQDYFQDGTRLCLVMEYIQGRNLFDLLADQGAFSEPIAKFYAAQIVLALEYMHNVNLIHRDLKPENIMVTSEGYVKVVDLGLSKLAERAGSQVGTCGFRAPEIVLEHSYYTKAVDWWALGIIVYEMIAGPFETPCVQMKVNGRNEYLLPDSEAIPFPRRFPNSVSLRNFVTSLLQNRPRNRLGYGKQGSKNVRNHFWFYDIVWLAIYNKEVIPPWNSRIRIGEHSKASFTGCFRRNKV